MPQPDSPTTASVLAGLQGERHAVERARERLRLEQAVRDRVVFAPGRALRARRAGRSWPHAAQPLSGKKQRACAPTSPSSAGRSCAAARPAHSGSAARAGSRSAGRSAPGTTPAIELQAPLADVVLGQRRQQRLGVRVARRFEDRRHVRRLDHLARIHHEHALRDFGDDAEVVRDQHQRHAAFALQLQQQRRASAPGWSRRARWSARRRSAGAGCTRSPSRPSRAGSCRPRAGAERHRAGARHRGSRPRAAARARARAAPCSSRLRGCAASRSAGSATVKHGFRLAIGSWKIIAMSRPSIWRRCFSGIVSRSRPSNAQALRVHAARARRSGPSARARSRSCPSPIRRRCRAPRRHRLQADVVDGARMRRTRRRRSLTSSSAIDVIASAAGRAHRAARRPSG